MNGKDLLEDLDKYVDHRYVGYNDEYRKLNEYIEKLEKIKDIFNIFKEFITIEKDKSLDGTMDFYKLYFSGEYPYETFRFLEKEQYELFEEIMKDETIL